MRIEFCCQKKNDQFFNWNGLYWRNSFSVLAFFVFPFIARQSNRQSGKRRVPILQLVKMPFVGITFAKWKKKSMKIMRKPILLRSQLYTSRKKKVSFLECNGTTSVFDICNNTKKKPTKSTAYSSFYLFAHFVV